MSSYRGGHADVHHYSALTVESCPIEGQVFTTCGTACPPTCSEPGPVACTTQCVVGCQCPVGTVLDDLQQKCVNLDQCGMSVIT